MTLYIVAERSEIDRILLTYLRPEETCKSDEIFINVSVKIIIND